MPDLVAVPVEADGLAVDDMTIDEASEQLARAVRGLSEALLRDPALSEASSAERQQFAKYLTLAKIRLENAIAVVRAGEAHGPEPVLSNSELVGSGEPRE